MRTTVNLPDPLVLEAKQAAREDNTTLTALIEAGQRTVLEGRRRRKRFVLRDASVDGRGPRPEFRRSGWEQVRDAIYHAAD
ncbi:MAG TPA: DUF2191 domain-containing protein [Candidatus Binatia bacterium]|nr:DUF2191 domain-containing protein [Candidatus Binatia bacterium]